jgi:hypothetical protein
VMAQLGPHLSYSRRGRLCCLGHIWKLATLRADRICWTVDRSTHNPTPDFATTNFDCVSIGTYIAAEMVQSDASRF